jgi:hypothetical protein
MKFQSTIIAFALAIVPAIGVCTEPVCEFADTSHRRISGTNPDDLRCIKLLAAAGDEHWQYYLGLILIGGVSGPKALPEGLAVLKKVALRNNKYSADAMRSIGNVYKQPDFSLQNFELSYQWLYLASQQPFYKGTTFLIPDEELSAVITPQRMKELESSAHTLLQDR